MDSSSDKKKLREKERVERARKVNRKFDEKKYGRKDGEAAATKRTK